MGWLKVLGAGRALGPFWASGCWRCPLFALVCPDGCPPSRETHLPLRVFLAGDFYLFFQHFLMNSIPKEANFLAGSGGSGSGYGGGWDSVQRFDHGSCRIWVLGAPGADADSSGGECLSPFLSLFVREVLFFGGDVGWGHLSSFPQFYAGPWGFAGRLSRAIPAGPPSKSVGLFLHPPPRFAPFISLSKEPSIFLGVGGDEVFARRMLGGGSTGTLWPPPSLDR